MNELEIIRKLGKSARKSQAPQTSVSRAVLARLRQTELEPNGSLGWVAVAASLIAIPVGLYAYFDFTAFSDPLLSFFFVVNWMAAI
jgi:hypothetical protein